MKYRLTAARASILSASVIASLGGAYAQSSAPATPAITKPVAGEIALGEIIVTATRRATSARRVPISIDAFSAKTLAIGGIKNIADLASVSPGLQYAEPNALPSTITTISIRGMNSNTGPSVVGEYLDDTPLQVRLSPLTNFGNPYPGVFDLNRVEVARGPQGTLFGAGAEAGTVRFITNEPSLTKFSGFAHTELAATQGGGLSYEAGVAGGGPIIKDKLGFRASVWDRHDGGYIDRVNFTTLESAKTIVQKNANTNDKLSARAALSFKLGDDIQITPSVFYQNSKRGDGGRFYEIISDASQGKFLNGRLLPEVSHDYLTVPSLKIEYTLPFAQLTSVTSYVYRSAHVNLDQSSVLGEIGIVPGFPNGGYGNPLGTAYPVSLNDINYTVYGMNLKGLTQELRLTSSNKDAFVTWVAGLFYDHRRQLDYLRQQSLDVDPTNGFIFFTNQTATDTQIAGFAQLDFHLAKGLTATLGGRIARVKTDLFLENGAGILNSGNPPTFSIPTSKETPKTPKVGLSYQLDKNNLFYGSVSKGYRIGGGNPALPSFCNVDLAKTETFKSDTVWNYEVGAKNTFLDGRVQLDASFFHARWLGIQQLAFLSCGFQYTANAGKATINGFDLSLHSQLSESLAINLNVGYSDATFTENVSDEKGNILILKGDKVGQLPQVNAPWNVNLAVDYKIPLAHENSLLLRGEYNYKSRNPGPFVTQIVGSPNYYPLIKADPAINLINLRAIYTLGSVDIGLNVNNVFNRHPLLQKFQEVSTANFINYNTLTPRTVGISLNVAY